MPRLSRRSFLFLLLSLLFSLAPAAARAQGEGQAPHDDDAARVMAALAARGYEPIEAGFAVDEQGQEDPSTVYVAMVAEEPNLDTDVTIRQVVFGFGALRDVYSDIELLVVVLEVDQYWLLFPSTAENFDNWYNELIDFEAFWQPIRQNAAILDTETGQYISETDFTSKDFTDKDFTGEDEPPVITDDEPLADENILLQPSTVFLPADGETVGFAIAQLSDVQGQPLAGEEVSFSYVAAGADPLDLGSVSTNEDAGTAIRPFTSSRALGSVLLRAQAGELGAGVPVLVGEAPQTNEELQELLAEAYAAEDYTFLEFALEEGTDQYGDYNVIPIMVTRMDERSFNRRVANQLLRSFATMYTLAPNATSLINLLVFTADDGQTYYIRHDLLPDIMQQWLNGEITAEEVLARPEPFVIGENGLLSGGGKDFINKNFTPPAGEAGVELPRTITATTTEEDWGEQHNAGIFRIAIGGSADGFAIEELAGGATGFELWDNGAMSAPLISWHEGDDESVLRSLRISEGQYLLAVIGPAPSSVTLSFVEHQSR